ncbi:MAG TPA: BTAD domain-containing putative transcriptional regulator [Micromonosporaceae bacterium]|nr:BTAD domain-containing putative transcriptional regulator [Micromonosporaceae bacterium]
MRDVGFRGLGTLEVIIGGNQLPTGGPLQRGLLATLLTNANRVISPDRLISALWSQPPETALGQVQTRIWRLRQLLQGGPGPQLSPRPQLVTRAGGYALIIEPEMFDVLVFDRHIAQAQALLAADRPREAVAELREALALWRGPAFADVPAPGIRVEAEVIEERRLGAIEQRIEIELTLGLHHQLVSELRELVSVHPFRERLRYHLMRALYRCGRRAEAVETYLEGYRTLVDGLGLEPSRDLREMHRAILVSDEPAEPPARPVAAWPPVSGEPRELPRDSVCLVGRECETAHLREYLKSADCGTAPLVVTISGAAGVGKSALAVRFAHLLSEKLFEGQFFASIGSGEPDPNAVLRRFLRTLGVPDTEIPQSLAERSALYRACLANRRFVLVLDDVQTEAQARPLLPAGPGCATLITSRRRLTALEGVYQVSLGPLADADMLTLLSRTVGPERVNAEPEPAARIVGYCTGLPLALRAVAARICARPHWSLRQFADVLEDESRRLAAFTFGDLDLRGAIESSYRRLSPPARRLFRLLGLLDRPQFSVADAGRLLDVRPVTAEELTEELAEERLVRPVLAAAHGEPGLRYEIDELWRLFARELVSAEETALERHEAQARVAA